MTNCLNVCRKLTGKIVTPPKTNQDFNTGYNMNKVWKALITTDEQLAMTAPESFTKPHGFFDTHRGSGKPADGLEKIEKTTTRNFYFLILKCPCSTGSLRCFTS